MPSKNICRLCLFEAPITFSLLKDNAHKMLETLTSIKLKPNDDILMVCLKCSLNLKLAYHIQQNILKADEKLRGGLLNNLTIKKEVTVKMEEITICENGLIENENKFNCIQLCDTICAICDLNVDDISMNSHIRQHFGCVQLCDLCNQSFGNIETYKRHLSKHPEYVGMQCSKCEAKFHYKSLYNIHRTKVHSDNADKVENNTKSEDIFTNKKFKKCDKSINEKADEIQKKGIGAELALKLASLSEIKRDCKKRLPKNDPNSPYTCNICPKQFITKRQFQNHNHSRKTCPICKKEITAYNFSKHVKNHTSGPQICEQCGKTYVGVQSLQDHILNKHQGKRYECQECKITFKNRQGLHGHKKREHTATPTSGYICETCGRRFTFAYDLKKHVQVTHLKKRPYVCEFCKKGFSGLHAMKTHRRQHTNETPYKCEICGEGFRQNVSLKTHRKSKHNIVETVTCQCKICGKDFASMHAVKSHMRCH